MSFFLEEREAGLWIGQFSLLTAQGISHGISTRFGGESLPPYDTMNLALHVGDESAAVIGNRKRFCSALGVDFHRLCTAEQVHGTQVAVVEERDAGRGAVFYPDSIQGTDALVTNVPDLPLLLCFADCVPLLFYDPIKQVVALAHAGWRGTLGRIAQKTFAVMQERFGSAPEHCMAAIAPAIGGNAYEVSAEIAKEFSRVFSSFAAEEYSHVDEKGNAFLDLPKLNFLQLQESGFLRQHIELSAACTVKNQALFFSYRAMQGRTGRIGAVIALKTQVERGR